MLLLAGVHARLRGAGGAHLAAAAAATLLLTGCSAIPNVPFTQDRRLNIESPRNLSTVRLPLAVRWTMREFTATTQGPPSQRRGQFAVFLDRYPMAPGKSLRSVVDSDPECRASGRCLEPAYLEAVLGVYVTTNTTIEVNAFPSADAARDDASHFATIVLLDSDGRRIGESVWYVSFRVAA